MNTVIFDMDGVILDSEYTYILAQQALLAEEGFQVPKEVFNEFIGMADPEVWQILVERYSLPHSPSHYLAQQGARHQAILAAEGSGRCQASVTSWQASQLMATKLAWPLLHPTP